VGLPNAKPRASLATALAAALCLACRDEDEP
jgi:hypothetical protein